MLQDLIVGLVALGAAAAVVWRFVRPAPSKEPHCANCPTADGKRTDA